MRFSVITAGLLASSASLAAAQSQACLDQMKDAYVSLATIPVMMSEAMTAARADGGELPPETLAEPDRFAMETEEWAERLIELANTWCR